MKKLFNVLLLLTSLIGFMEWSGGNAAFLFQVEMDLFFGGKANEDSLAHPFVLLPLLGQMLLLFTLVRRKPSDWLSYLGLACLSLIMLMLLLIGMLQMNWKMISGALPFVVTAIFKIRYDIKIRRTKRLALATTPEECSSGVDH